MGAKLKVTRQMQIWVEPEKNPDACRLDKQLPLGFIFVNNDNFVFGHASIPGSEAQGIKFGDMGGDLGSLGIQFPEVTNADYVKEYTQDEIETFRKETAFLIPASKG